MKLWERQYRFCSAPGAAAFVALLLVAWAPQARAQGARKDDVVINGAGQPVGGASISVCNSTATIGTSTTPCSPLATIYTDATLTTPAANPFPADGLGNYGFWAPPGTYQVQLYGTQIATTLKTVVLPCVPGSSCAGGGSSSPSAAMKAGASDAIEYVSPNGNDSNDGLSIGTAKLTIMAGYDALGQGGGTIYISGSSTSGAYCTSTPGQGIWIMGSADPNYASPPAGWRKMKLGGPVYFVGLSANTSPAASTTSWTTVVNCGNNTNPGVWLSGASGVTISRLRMVSESARVSMDSNGGRNNATNPSAQIEFDHDDFRSDCSGCGPAMDVGGNMLWLNVHDSTFENGAITNWSVSANSSQASNISISNGGGSGPIGLLYFTQNFFSGGGGLRFDANTNSSASVYAAHTLMEGAGACQPVFEIINGGTFAATFDLQGGFSDCGASPPFVKVAAGNQPCQTSVRGINQGGQVPGLEGPLTVGDAICPGGNPSGGVSVSDAGVPSAGVIPAAKGQSGGAYGTSQNADSDRRSFAPSLVRFANTANQLPATWTAYQGSGQTLTPIQGPGDPAGSTNAATLSCTGQSGFGCSYYVFDSNITFNAGDYVYVGAWIQAASTAGFGSGSAIGVIFPFANGPTMRQMTGGPAGVGGAFSGGTTQLSSSPYLQNDGNWQYVWGLSKVTAPFSGVSGTIFAFAFQPGYPVNVYAPMFVRVPASSVALVSAPTFSSASESGNIVTFTTSAAHKLSKGEPIVVSGCSVSGYNGEFVLGNTISSTTFTVYNSATGLGSPTGCVITPENDSEVADWANNLKPYSDKCSTGVLCGVVSNPAMSASGLNNIIFVDGVTYPTIQAALTAAGANGEVVIPPGTYGTSTCFTLPSGVWLHGSGAGATTINSTCSGVGIDYAFGSHVRVSDLTFSSTTTTTSIKVSGTHVQLDNVRVVGAFSGKGVWVTGNGSSTQSNWVTLNNVKIGDYDFTGTGLQMDHAVDVTISDSFDYSATNGTAALDFVIDTGTSGVYVSNFPMGFGLHGLIVQNTSGGAGAYNQSPINLQFDKLFADTTPGGDAILFDSTLGSNVVDAAFTNSWAAAAGLNNALSIITSSANGLNIEGGTGISWNGRIRKNALNGVKIGSANVNRVTISSGSFVTANNQSNNADGNGIYVTAAATNIKIDGTVSGNVLDTGGNQVYGIKVAAVNADQLSVTSSDFNSNATGACSISDTGNYILWANFPTSGPCSQQVYGNAFFQGILVAATGFNLNNTLFSNTAPTISSGFGGSPSIVQQNGTAAFEVNVGTGGSATSGVVGLPTAANGWSCTAIDMNTNDVTRETAFTTTTVTLNAASAWTASDKLLVNCAAF